LLTSLLYSFVFLLIVQPCILVCFQYRIQHFGIGKVIFSSSVRVELGEGALGIFFKVTWKLYIFVLNFQLVIKMQSIWRDTAYVVHVAVLPFKLIQ